MESRSKSVLKSMSLGSHSVLLVTNKITRGRPALGNEMEPELFKTYVLILI